MQSSSQTIIETTGVFNDLFYLITGGYLGLFLLAFIMMLLFLFLPFFIFGIWNQAKRTNKNLQKVIELLDDYEKKLKQLDNRS
jgi:uncharacterized membrane protein